MMPTTICVDPGPEEHEKDKNHDESPTAHAITHFVGCSLANGEVLTVFFMPVQDFFLHSRSIA